MLRRVFHPSHIKPGLIPLEPGEARHVRDVLRLSAGDVVELFDDARQIAHATIVEATHAGVVVRVDSVDESATRAGPAIVIASAVPKGDRAEWMVEKLSELGVDRFVPLATARSVVHPEGKNKRDRWTRIATEAAKQSRRAGVMTIDPLTSVSDTIAGATATNSPMWVLSPEAETSALDAVGQSRDCSNVVLFIGPEGGWTEDELSAFAANNVRSFHLTQTILRVETAAVLAGGLFALSHAR